MKIYHSGALISQSGLRGGQTSQSKGGGDKRSLNDKFCNVVYDVALGSRIHITYAIIAITVGLLFVFLVPPGQNYDENAHYYRAVSIAQGNIIDKTSIDEKSGEVIAYSQVQQKDDNLMHDFQKCNFTSKKCDYDLPLTKYLGNGLQEGQSISLKNSTEAVYSPLVFAPQILAQKISNMLDVSVFKKFMLMRLLGLLLAVFIVSFAIKKTVKGKFFLFAFGLHPMVVYGFSSISADGITYAIIFAFLAVLSKYIWGNLREITVVDKAVFSLLIISIGIIKVAYIPIALLSILPIIIRKIDIISKVIIVISAALSVAVGLVWYKAISNVWINFQDSSLQSDYILHHPLQFLKTFLISLMYDGGDHSLGGSTFRLYNLFGGFANTTATLHPFFVTLLIVAITLSVFISTQSRVGSDIRHTRLIPISFVATAVITVFLIYLSLYMVYNVPGAHYISGIQGRYFIPIIPLLVIPFVSRFEIPSISANKCKLFIAVSMIAVLLVSVLTVVTRFYY